MSPAVANSQHQLLLLHIVDPSADHAPLPQALADARLPVTYRCLPVESAQAYLAALPPFSDRSQHPLPDLVILDTPAPHTNAFELLDSARHCQLAMFLILDSGKVEDQLRAYKLGARAVFTRAFALQVLVTAIAALLPPSSFR